MGRSCPCVLNDRDIAGRVRYQGIDVILRARSPQAESTPTLPAARSRPKAAVSWWLANFGNGTLARDQEDAVVSGSCSSARGFASPFFQSSPHGRDLGVHLDRYDLLSGGLFTSKSHVMLGTQRERPGRGVIRTRALSSATSFRYRRSPVSRPYPPPSCSSSRASRCFRWAVRNSKSSSLR